MWVGAEAAEEDGINRKPMKVFNVMAWYVDQVGRLGREIFDGSVAVRTVQSPHTPVCGVSRPRLYLLADEPG